jgi:hypothetical protein
LAQTSYQGIDPDKILKTSIKILLEDSVMLREYIPTFHTASKPPKTR